MVVLYRSEKKKIIRSQLNLCRKVAQILDKIEKTLMEQTDPGQQSLAYTKLLMQPTAMEKILREATENAGGLEA